MKKENLGSVKALKKQLGAAVAMVCVAAVALGSSTYAWFVNNARVTATDVSVTASTAYSLLISKDRNTWGTTEALNGTAVNLIPASTIGEKNDTTGALKFVTDTAWTGNYASTFKEVTSTDSVNITTTTGNSVTSKYFYTDTVYLKSAQAANLYLDKTGTGIGTTTNGNVATKQFDATDLTAQQKAMLNTLRVAFVVKNETQNTEAVTYVYQLVADGTGTTHYNTTKDSTTADIDGVKGAVAVDGTPTKFTNFATNEVPVITSKMATGSQAGYAITNKAESLGTVAANDVVKVDVYVWMEGCDYDVNATNLVNFQEAAIEDMMFGFCIGQAN